MTFQVPPTLVTASPADPAMGTIDTPDLGSIAIRFPNVFTNGKPLQFDYFLSYEYHDHFLTRSDGWRFDLAVDMLSDIDKIAIVPRTRVEVSIDDVLQSIGFIDDVTITASRTAGTIMTLAGRDWLAPAVDGHVSPKSRFKPTDTLDRLLQEVFGPFGMTVESIDNIANRNSITGRIYGTPVSKKGKPLKSYILHEIKPYPQEGAFAFAARVSQRFGLWLWPANDGKTVICGKPDFSQPSRYQLRHKTSDGGIYNNVLESRFTLSAKDQPSVILASGFGGGGDFAHSSIRSAIVNPIINTDISAIEAAFPDVKFVTAPDALQGAEPITDPSARPLYLYDSESHTQQELDAFVLRELSLRTRKSLEASYTILGHRLGGQPICVDTICDVNDDRSNFYGPLWVIGRSFSKRPSEGTRSVVELIRPNTLTF